MIDSLFYYLAYGLCLQSSWPLPLPKAEHDSATITLGSAPASFFIEAVQQLDLKVDGSKWFYHFRLDNRVDYLLWPNLFEFIISADGQQIWGRILQSGSLEMFQTYLLGQVISFSLIKRGVEPIHSTAIVIDGEAVAFLGDSGYGKSTLAGAFLQAGFKLLTDDILVINNHQQVFMAHPGPPRIKLFPTVAKILLDENIIGSKMNPDTTKLVLPLPPEQSSQNAVPISRIYAIEPPNLESPSDSIAIHPLSQRQACMKLIENTYNTVSVGLDRQKQLLNSSSQLATGLSIKSLSYPRDLSRLTEVIEIIQADVV